MRSGSDPASAIIFFCHGARDPRWREPFDRIVESFAHQYPGTPVELAFLELMTPSLPEVIDRLAGQGITRIRIMPLFLAAGGHTRRDLVQLVNDASERWPACQFDTSPTLTESEEIREAIVSWAARCIAAP